MAKKSSKERPNVIAQVTTPLAFFTLGVLVIEGILGSLSFRAGGSQLTILIVGMLIGFALLCSMVFFLAINPARRYLLLGAEPTRPPATLIRSMQLTPNDIRVLYRMARSSGGIDPYEADKVALGDRPMSGELRLEKFSKLGLVEPIDPHDDSHDLWPHISYRTTSEGHALAMLIYAFAQAVDELERASIKKG